MSDLARKLREARKIEIKVGDVTFFATRPTVEQIYKYGVSKTTDPDICRAHVYGWKGVLDRDLFPTGTDDPIDFEKGLFDDIIADRADWWAEVAQKLVDATSEYAKVTRNLEKNS